MIAALVWIAAVVLTLGLLYGTALYVLIWMNR